jgi:FtsP/CotA-like multicopper oxidase with cupredoxin domain
VEEYLEEYYSDIDEGGQGPRNQSADEFTVGRMKPPDANEMGWKDTVRANPGEITRIMVPFGADVGSRVPMGISFTGDYVWHCHILEHEDNEMMLPYRVVAA